MIGVSEKTKLLDSDCVGGGLFIEKKFELSEGAVWDAWKYFSRGKLRQLAVQKFWLHAEREIILLYRDLVSGAYVHGRYEHFVVQDTKRRDIFVATVRDRVVHQLISTELEQIYSRRFYTYSCAAQRGKGVSAARAYVFARIRTLQARGRVWFAKLDVRHYFSSIDQKILLEILSRRVQNPQLFDLCRRVILSFGIDGRGLPLGNLTSQWFANIYLHELDWFMKYELCVQNYMRYNDDVIVLTNGEVHARETAAAIQKFVAEKLKLEMPDAKTQIGRFPQTLDVLGVCTNGERRWVRQTTVHRARVRLQEKIENNDPALIDARCSYSHLSHLINFAYCDSL